MLISVLRYWPVSKPIPNGWILASDLKPSHHSIYSVLIKKMPAPKTIPRIIDGEWLLCLECRCDWPVMWNDESQIPTLVEINGRCIECCSEKVVMK